MTGGAIARAILDASKVDGVLVATGAAGNLANEYDHKRRLIILARHVYYRSSTEAIAIGAHEAGHAIQHARRYWLFMIRAWLFPLSKLAAGVLPLALIVAAVTHSHELLRSTLLAYCVLTAFHLLTLRIEYDASNRAYFALRNYQLVEFGSKESCQIQRLFRLFLWRYVWSFALAPVWLVAALFKR